MMPLAVLITVVVSLLALHDWRKGLLAVILVGVLQDVLRKLTTGVPTYFIVWSMAVYLMVAAIAFARRSLPPLGTIYLGDNQELARRPALLPSLLTRVISRFHLTYLIIEAIDNAFFKARDRNKRIDLGYSLEHAQNYHSPEADRIEEDFVKNRDSAQLRESILLLIEILKEWEQEVNRQGGQFSVVLLPREIENRAEKLIRESGFRTVNLFTFFSREITEYNYSDWCFKNDPHWNEAANYVAAQGLYADLSDQVPVELMSSDEMDRLLFTYYSSFDYGWMPGETRAEEPPTSEELDAIRSKYSSVETSR